MGIEVIGISKDSVKSHANFAAKQGHHYQYAFFLLGKNYLHRILLQVFIKKRVLIQERAFDSQPFK